MMIVALTAPTLFASALVGSVGWRLSSAVTARLPLVR